MLFGQGISLQGVSSEQIRTFFALAKTKDNCGARTPSGITSFAVPSPRQKM